MQCTARKKRIIFLICSVVCFTDVSLQGRPLHAFPAALERAITFLEKNQNEDGGWGYWPGHKSYTEPTGLCLLALSCAGSSKGLKGGLDYLKRCQLDSGALGIDEHDKEGSWMSYAALLAFHALGAFEEEKCLKNWILGFYDGYNNTAPDIVESMYREFRYDMTIDGWPWFGTTNSWVEPTALLISALTYAGIDPEHTRISSGLRMLIDRTNKTGGWNYGNPFVKGTYLDAYPLPTSIALLAMGVAGYTEASPVVTRGINFLEQCRREEMSIAALAWTLLAFNNFSTTKEKADSVSIILNKRQMADGSFRSNLFETALSSLALSGFTFIHGSNGLRK